MELVDQHLLALCLMVVNSEMSFDRAIADAKVLMEYHSL